MFGADTRADPAGIGAFFIAVDAQTCESLFAWLGIIARLAHERSVGGFG